MRIATVLFACGLLTLAGLALAPAASARAETTAADHQEAISQTPGWITSLDFKGGTLEAYTRAVEKASNQRLNVLFTPGTSQVRVPPVQLVETDANDALMAIVAISERTALENANGQRMILGLDTIGESSMIYLFDAYDAGYEDADYDADGAPVAIERNTVILPITELITGTGAMSADDVLSALQAALAMEGGEEVKLAYHEGTGLLFARVTAKQSEVISDTIMSLRVSRESRGERERRDPLESTLAMVGAKDVNDLIMKVNLGKNLRNQILDLQAINAQQQDRIIQLQDELAELKRYLAAVERKLKDGGN